MKAVMARRIAYVMTGKHYLVFSNDMLNTSDSWIRWYQIDEGRTHHLWRRFTYDFSVPTSRAEKYSRRTSGQCAMLHT